MAQQILKRVNRIFDIITVFLIISGGVIFHLVTVFAVKGTHGVSWGIIAFIFPGLAELGFAASQLAEGNLKYPVLFCLCLGIVTAKLVLLYGKKVLVRRLRRRYETAEQF